jgi:hypothetical protein
LWFINALISPLKTVIIATPEPQAPVPQPDLADCTSAVVIAAAAMVFGLAPAGAQFQT